jgi:uncharacterized C2H2 Zn-finger protein
VEDEKPEQNDSQGKEIMIYCSQCGKQFRKTEIVIHWEKNHGYKIYYSKDKTSE